MGAEPWSYFIPYQPNIQAAMESLQEQEFAAGRYHSKRDYQRNLPAPTSIDDLRANYLTEEGSRSILDMLQVVDDPQNLPTWGPISSDASGLSAEDRELLGLAEDEDIPDELREFMGSESMSFCTAVKLPAADLLRLYGTAQPSRQQIESNSDYFENIGRGCGIYIIAYRDGKPDEIHFAGYSFD